MTDNWSGNYQNKQTWCCSVLELWIANYCIDQNKVSNV